MNERIRELLEQAGLVGANGHFEYDFFDPEKFAQLMVRECVDVVSEIPVIDNGHPHPAWKIKQHFGVD
jgi:8-oxo-dGTP pyrophosphatase MutT (NUDIX family)